MWCECIILLCSQLFSLFQSLNSFIFYRSILKTNYILLQNKKEKYFIHEFIYLIMNEYWLTCWKHRFSYLHHLPYSILRGRESILSIVISFGEIVHSEFPVLILCPFLFFLLYICIHLAKHTENNNTYVTQNPKIHLTQDLQ